MSESETSVDEALLWMNIQQTIKEKFESGEVVIDGNGHFDPLSDRYADYFVTTMASTFAMRVSKKKQKEILDAMLAGKAIEKPVEWKSVMLDCQKCGHNVRYAFDGKTISVLPKCKYPDGLPIYSIELDVPSGVMVFDDDLRHGFPDFDSRDIDVNLQIGIKFVTEKYAKLGLAHGFVGNTCPHVYKYADDKFAIGCEHHFDDEEDKDKTPIFGDAEELVQIVTDLWWYSCCDYDDYVKRFKGEPKDKMKVKCEPGKYRFSHQYHTMTYETRGKPFVLIERIG